MLGNLAALVIRRRVTFLLGVMLFIVIAGAVGGNIETVHSLRGDAISILRNNQVQPRAARLQAGHELTSTHDKYGFKALSAEECQAIATQSLRPQIDWEVFKGLDFDALARGRRSGKLSKES